MAAEGFHNESEAGIVITSGNTRTQSLNFKQTDSYGWQSNVLTFKGNFLRTTTSGTENARYWTLGLRYDRVLSEHFNVYVGQAVESNLFAGYLQRYNTDLGGKYYFEKSEGFEWSAELGYRYTLENRLSGPNPRDHYVRGYTEAMRAWNQSVSTKLWVELLPNLTRSSDYQINTELSVSAALTEIFSVKSAYLVRFDHEPAPGALEKVDTLFTTSLVAKF